MRFGTVPNNEATPVLSTQHDCRQILIYNKCDARSRDDPTVIGGEGGGGVRVSLKVSYS